MADEVAATMQCNEREQQNKKKMKRTHNIIIIKRVVGDSDSI